ncbi:hypothetical protein OESDEN_05561 [Oesophagostomum dentatum]|uniref:Dipeptidylpeptidase IV N-terminal domain-containing protein n=1 Tax=Oesophagostomum dentatum TaxID=61180 RepID=A0A0B1TFB1_OESDE|nr:hypothetical protein OESDEN_05561 [Oesophagostomum dentatum]
MILLMNIFEYKYPSKTWAEPKDFKSLYSDDAIYIMLPRPKPDGNSYQHIAKLLLQKDASGQITAKSAFLSLGNYDIEDLISYDAATDTLYYRAYAPSSTNLHLFSTKGSPTTADVWKCVSCMSANCTYQTNTISPDLNHVVTMCRVSRFLTNF